MGSNPTLSAMILEYPDKDTSFGEVAERLKAHAWKACVPQKGTEGSNPSLSALSRVMTALMMTGPGDRSP